MFPLAAQRSPVVSPVVGAVPSAMFAEPYPVVAAAKVVFPPECTVVPLIVVVPPVAVLMLTAVVDPVPPVPRFRVFADEEFAPVAIFTVCAPVELPNVIAEVDEVLPIIIVPIVPEPIEMFLTVASPIKTSPNLPDAVV
jgi:hypothetical protein